ncbi:CMP-sialic acid transporter 3 [Zea mays]|uniref:CMP-sialic acid transporter 3 n=1 Tax=Zea mays TaxID=4577 RepID=A0A1D6Q4G0_MAIZE|nr:CMP-sialic acid transporter 3 [Zea mays]
MSFLSHFRFTFVGDSCWVSTLVYPNLVGTTKLYLLFCYVYMQYNDYWIKLYLCDFLSHLLLNYVQTMQHR